MTEKNCTTCKKSKLLSEFSKAKLKTDGYRDCCKYCDSVRKSIYRKTKDGITSIAYGNQIQNSQRRNDSNPEYSLKELRSWAYKQQIFHNLYDEWVKSGYKKMLKPSFDRKDDYQGYSLDRLAIMTWQENFNKGHSDMKNGINNKKNKAVVQMNLDGSFIKEFHSISEAVRQTGVNGSSISLCCTGKQKVTKGYRYMFGLGIKIHSNAI